MNYSKYILPLFLLAVGFCTLVVWDSSKEVYGVDLSQRLIPRDANEVPVAPVYGDDGANFKPLGMSGAIFDKLYSSTIETVDDVTASVVYIGGVSAAGVVVTNHSTSIMKVWFDAAHHPNQGTYDFYVRAGLSVFYPVRADTIYILSVVTAPNIEIQSGLVN